MTGDPDTMPPGKTAIEALRLMEDGRQESVDEGGSEARGYRREHVTRRQTLTSDQAPARLTWINDAGLCLT